MSQRCFTRIPRLCQVFGLVLVVFSDSRSSINPSSSSSFYPSVYFCSLGEYVSRPLLRRSLFFYHRFRLCLVSLRTSLVFLDLAINSFLSRTILVPNISFRSVSFPLHLLSRLRLCTRLDIFNVFLTISSIRSNPSFVLPTFFPTFPSAIFNFLSRRLRQCTLVLRSHLLLMLLGSLSVPLCFYSPFSMSFLMSLRLLRRRLRDRPRHFFIPSSSFRLLAFSAVSSLLCNCSTRTSNPCCQCNSILYRLSVSSSLPPPSSLHLLSVYPPLRFADVLTFTFR